VGGAVASWLVRSGSSDPGWSPAGDIVLCS